MTPHALTLVAESGELIELPKGEQIARLAVQRTALEPVSIGGVNLAVNLPVMGEIEGLPTPQEGVILVVSALVAGAALRRDVMSPGELIRNEQGVIVGAKGLCAYTE